MNGSLAGFRLFNPVTGVSDISNKQRFHCTVLLGVFFFCFPTSVTANNQENLKSLRDRIQHLQRNLTDKESLRQETSDALQKTTQTIAVISNNLSKLKQEDQKAIAEYRQLQTQHQQLKDEIESQRDQISALLYRQYIAGQQDYLRLAMNQQNPNQIARTTYYYRQFAQARADNIQDLRLNQEKLAAFIQSSEQKRIEITAIQAEYFEQQKKLEQEKAKQQQLLAQVSGEITKQQHEIDKLKRDEKRLTELIDEISKATTRNTSPSTTSSQINNKLPDASIANTPFVTLKGKLNLPVRGKLVHTFGGQRTGKQLTWKGLFIQSIEGSEVRAISAGKVIFADWLRGFGNLIIIDHGNNYMSLYGNNATLRKQTGDTLLGGETIATVGNSSGNLDSGLYFELRHQGKPFDPLTWIKIE